MKQLYKQIEALVRLEDVEMLPCNPTVKDTLCSGLLIQLYKEGVLSADAMPEELVAWYRFKSHAEAAFHLWTAAQKNE